MYCFSYTALERNILIYFNSVHHFTRHSYDLFQKQVTKKFDINNDYLRATFNILSEPRINIDSTSSCNCHYPKYVKACHNFQSSSSLSASLSPIDPVNNFDEKTKTHSYFPPSCLKHSPSLRIHFNDTA